MAKVGIEFYQKNVQQNCFQDSGEKKSMAEVGLKKKFGKFEYLIVLSAPAGPRSRSNHGRRDRTYDL